MIQRFMGDGVWVVVFRSQSEIELQKEFKYLKDTFRYRVYRIVPSDEAS